MQTVFLVSASIACGKSSFIKLAQERGYKTLSADLIAHKILDENAKTISELFSNKELIKDNKIDRKALAKIVFNDKNELKKLENFTHPRIKDEILTELSKSKNEVVFVEIPLFFESTNYKNIGKSILIYAPKEKMCERLMKRDKINKEEALKRISLQMDIEEKKKMADFVIDNSGDFENFKKNSENFFRSLESEAF